MAAVAAPIRRAIYLPGEYVIDIVSYIYGTAYNITRWGITFAVEVVIETRDKLLIVSLAIIQVLDNVRQKLKLPIPFLARARRLLQGAVESTLQSRLRDSKESRRQFLNDEDVERLSKQVSASEVWDAVGRQELDQFIVWISTALNSVNRILNAPRELCGKMYIYASNNLPLVKSSVQSIEKVYALVERIVSRITSGQATNDSSRRAMAYIHHQDERSVTAVVLEYHEREPVVEPRVNQIMMHYRVPLNPFDATVRLPESVSDEDTDEENGETRIKIRANKLVCTPQSFPPSPGARKQLLSDFSHWADDIIYMARDQLRSECAASLRINIRPMVTFNPKDAHRDLVFACNYHCVMKNGATTYPSVRANTKIERNRYVYFQMSITKFESPMVDRRFVSDQDKAVLAIGVSSQKTPLNVLVGSVSHSVGVYSSGYLVADSRWLAFPSGAKGFDYGSNIGILVYIDGTNPVTTDAGTFVRARMRFTIDDKALGDASSGVFHCLFPEKEDLYPTVSLYTPLTRVLSHFSASDIVNPSRAILRVPHPHHVYALDGSRLFDRLL